MVYHHTNKQKSTTGHTPPILLLVRMWTARGGGSVLKSQKYEYETTFWQKCCHFSTILAPPIFNSDIRPRVEKNEIWLVVLSCMEVEFCWKLPNYYQILSIFFKLCSRLKNTILLNVFMPVILLSLFVSYQSRTITAPEKQFHHTRFLWTDSRFYSTPVCCALWIRMILPM